MFTQNVGGLDRTLRIWCGLALLLVGLLLLGGFAGSGLGLAVAADRPPRNGSALEITDTKAG